MKWTTEQIRQRFDNVFHDIDAEDTSRPALFQTDLRRAVRFDSVEILHKNRRFAAFGALKSGVPTRG